MKASMSAVLAKCRPRATMSAWRIFVRIALWLRGAGNEPRVPQNLINTATYSGTQNLPDYGTSVNAVAHCIENLYKVRHSTNPEDLTNYGLQAGDREPTVGRLKLLGRDHQYGQASAGNELHARHVYQHRHSQQSNGTQQLGLKSSTGFVVHPSDRSNYSEGSCAPLTDSHQLRHPLARRSGRINVPLKGIQLPRMPSALGFCGLNAGSANDFFG
jgi:hypothetical protein